MTEKLIEQLHTPDPSDKRYALESLYDNCCEEKVLEAASNLLTDPDRGVREAASHLLVLCSSQKAATLTAGHISSRNIAVRNLAGDALVRMGPSAVTALIPYADSADKDVRKFAIDVIAQLPVSPAAISKVAEKLTDPDPNVVCAAIDALGSMHAGQYLQRMVEMYEGSDFARPNIVNAAAKFPAATRLNFLIKALEDENPVVQLAAAEALSVRKDGNLLTILVQKLSTVSALAKPVILHSIVVLMGSSPSAQVLPPHLKTDLLTMLDDPDPVYVRAAVRGLSNFVDDDVLSSFISHSGRDESVDAEILSILKDHAQSVVRLVIDQPKNGGPSGASTGIVLALLRLIMEDGPTPIDANILDQGGLYLADHFADLDAESKIVALSICSGFSKAASVRLTRIGLEDHESSVKSLALDLVSRTGPQFFNRELEALKTDYDEEIRFTASALMTQLKPGYQSQD